MDLVFGTLYGFNAGEIGFVSLAIWYALLVFTLITVMTDFRVVLGVL